MNAKKAKAIRKAMKKELEQGSVQDRIFHASVYTNIYNEKCLRYRVQYVNTGGKQLVELGKKIYNLSGVLPKEAV
jgi:hypothetical protein